MSRQYWVAPVGPMRTASYTEINTFSTITDATATGAAGSPRMVLPANVLDIGSEVEIEAHGEYSTTAAPTFTINLCWATTGTILAVTTSLTGGSGVSNVPWYLRYRGTVRAVGTAGSIQGQALAYWTTGLSTAFSVNPAPITLAGRTVTIDTTGAQPFLIAATCSASSASNKFKVDYLGVRLTT